MGNDIMYQIIVYSTICILAVLGCAGILIDWDKIGYKYFPETFRKPNDK